MSRFAILAVAMLSAGACRPQPADPAAIDRGNALDVAASEANLIVDPATTSPIGLYERTHVAGADGMCLAESAGGELRFGLVMRFGATLSCEGSGQAEHRGSTLRLRFEGADCAVDVAYDGQSVRIPGSVEDGCAALCGPRASISGGAMPRVGWSGDDALRLRSARAAGGASSRRQLCASAAAP